MRMYIRGHAHVCTCPSVAAGDSRDLHATQDHGERSARLVILCPDEPSRQIRQLLSHPQVRMRTRQTNVHTHAYALARARRVHCHYRHMHVHATTRWATASST